MCNVQETEVRSAPDGRIQVPEVSVPSLQAPRGGERTRAKRTLRRSRNVGEMQDTQSKDTSADNVEEVDPTGHIHTTTKGLVQVQSDDKRERDFLFRPPIPHHQQQQMSFFHEV